VLSDSQSLMSDEELARMLQARPLIWLIFRCIFWYLTFLSVFNAIKIAFAFSFLEILGRGGSAFVSAVCCGGG